MTDSALTRPAELPEDGAPGQARARARASRRRRATVTFTVLALLLAAGGYTAAAASAPLPALLVTLSNGAGAGADIETEISAVSAGAQAIVDERPLPTAIGWAHGTEVWANDGAAYPIASIVKLVTALVTLEAEPLAPGTNGPIYTWTAEDRERQDEYVAMMGIAHPIPVGTELTVRDMLTLMLLPSSNDFAAAFAYRVFGDNESFLAAVERFSAQHGLTSLTVVEPTGLDEGNRASAADLVRIARLALQNPTIREFTSMQSVEMPWGIGTIENTNPLLGEMPGVVGLKTGTLEAAGYNLVVAQETNVHGRDLVKISVTLARPDQWERAESGRIVLSAMDDLPQLVDLVAAGENIGSIVTWQGETVPLITAGAAAVTLLPGEGTQRSIELGSGLGSGLGVGLGSGPAGTPVGDVVITAPEEVASVPIVTTDPIIEPDLWWRLTHPHELFGW